MCGNALFIALFFAKRPLDNEGLPIVLCEVKATLNDRTIAKLLEELCDLEALTLS